MSTSTEKPDRDDSVAAKARELLGKEEGTANLAQSDHSDVELDTISTTRYHDDMSRKRGLIRVALRRAFHESGWSLKRLTEVSGTAYASTHGFFVNDRHATVESVEKWCRALGLELVPKTTKRKSR